MNDDFLCGFRQPPSPEFAQSLYARLVNEEKAQKIMHRTAGKRAALALAVLSLAFALLMYVSPAARAAAQQVINELIGKITLKGITFFVSSDSADPSKFPQEGESYELVWTPLSPSEISSDYSFLARMPAWVPSGYILQDRAALYYVSYPIKPIPPDTAVFQWKNRAGEMIELMEQKGSCPYEPSGSGCTGQLSVSVGMNDEPQVIAVNDHPGVIFGGMTATYNLADPVKKWNPERWKIVPKGLTMIWENGGTTFWLITNSQKVSRDNLIRLAESIP
jgi:hypothetical protein